MIVRKLSSTIMGSLLIDCSLVKYASPMLQYNQPREQIQGVSMTPTDVTIRAMAPTEVPQVAQLLAQAYYHDVFFKWCVDSDKDRIAIVAAYYTIYIQSRGAVVHVATDSSKQLLGATVWLPHDGDADMYADIIAAVGPANAPMFQEVAERSHANEPTGTPFYQLVGFGVTEAAQGRGIGHALLKHNLDHWDVVGIPTYLEASTPYTVGKGVYGKFGYLYHSPVMTFTDTAILYPLYRKAGGN